MSNRSAVNTDALAWNPTNRLPTPAPSDSSRNTSPTAPSSSLLPPTSSSTFFTLPRSKHYVPDQYSPPYADQFSISSHQVDLSDPPKDRTNAFFSSPKLSSPYDDFVLPPPPPQRSKTISHRSSSTPSDSSVSLSRSASDSRQRYHAGSRVVSSPEDSVAARPPPSLDIFFARDARPPSPPSPPPPLASHRSSRPTKSDSTRVSPGPSDVKSPTIRSRLPPLARLFPSRYRRDPRDFETIEDDDSLLSRAFQTSPESALFPTDVNPLPSSEDASSAQSHQRLPLLSHPSITSSESSITPTPTPWEASPSASNSPPSGFPLSDTPYPPVEGSSLNGFTFLRHLGEGAFSSVWLARDESDEPLKDPVGERAGVEEARKRRDRARNSGVEGLRPTGDRDELSVRPMGRIDENELTSDQGANQATGRLVAIKMLDSKMCEKDGRMRVSFVREVEVLRHISHPNIVSYLASFTTPAYNCLVLEYVSGGDLFELVNNTAYQSSMTEGLLRRIWSELVLAVGWMHSVNLVHRDIKLENILLTTNPFALSPLDPTTLVPHIPPTTTPLLKLTDFNLARFIPPSAPLLTTRCGSEFYAAPEIIMGLPYDGRKTDAWAVGVCLYACVTGSLPFDLKEKDGGERGLVRRESNGGRRSRSREADSKRSYFMRIAKGEWSWPGDDDAHEDEDEEDCVECEREREEEGRKASGDSYHSFLESDGLLGVTSQSIHRRTSISSVGSNSSISVGSSYRPRGFDRRCKHHRGHSSRHASELTTATTYTRSAFSTYSTTSTFSTGTSIASASSASSPPTHSPLHAQQDLDLATRQAEKLSLHPPLLTPHVRRLVAKLLVRDASRRSGLLDLWSDEWLRDSELEGSVPIPAEALASLEPLNNEVEHMIFPDEKEDISRSIRRSASSGFLVEEASIGDVAREEIYV